jgi:hypothetical protein
VISITVEVIGLREIINGLQRDKTPIIERRLDNIADAILEGVVSETPRRTGRLAKGHYVTKRPLERRIIEGEPYGKIVRQGAKPHPIYPRAQKALFWPGLSHPIRYVKRHPGIKSNQYHLRGVKIGMVKAESDVKALGQDLVIDVAKG